MTSFRLNSRRDFIGSLPLLTLAASRSLSAAAAAHPRVGCQANGFSLKPGDFAALLEALRSMHGLGYAGFECNIRFVQAQFDRTREARREIEATGVGFIGAHMSMELAKSKEFPRWVDHLKELGAQCIVMSGAGIPASGVFPREFVQQKAAALNAIAGTCHQGGLRLAYHNHNPEFANHNAGIEGLARETDASLVEFLIDAGHAHLGGGDPVAFFQRFPRRVLGFHVKTYKGGEQHQVPLGQGDWGFEDLAAAIQSAGWSGWLITEEGGGPTGGNTAALGPDREYIRRVFGT